MIAYIDESSEEIRRFQRYASDDFEVVPFEPPEDLDDMITQVLDSNALAVISDYNLTEYNRVARYDGVDVVTGFLKIKPGFPAFVLTSFDENAADESSDVNLVYTKRVLNEDLGIPFKERVRKQIKHYLQKIESNRRELDLLLKKREETKLTIQEEERLIEVDTFLEQSINAQCALPKDLKVPSNADKLSELLKSTKDLIEELKVQKR